MSDLSMGDPDFGDRVRAHREATTNAKRARKKRSDEDEAEKLNDELTPEQLRERQKLNAFRLRLMNAGRK